ncbi:MAG: hypothetical protein FVQ81_15660 [Candidatus Glassbacteria bacterium]|nr:hypothetical protein [Candidatus Glassbacteria bacterium]
MSENVLIVMTIAVLEGLLSADNALVLAVPVRGLPKEQHRKAAGHNKRRQATSKNATECFVQHATITQEATCL